MKTRLWLCVLIGLLLIGPQPAAAQEPEAVQIQYGDLITDEFTEDQTRFEYVFETERGDGIAVKLAVPIGASLRLSLFDSRGDEVDDDWGFGGLLQATIYAISNGGTYRIEVGPDELGFGELPVLGEFSLKLEQVPVLTLAAPVSGTTSVQEGGVFDRDELSEFTFLFVSEERGYFTIHYTFSTAAEFTHISLTDPNNNTDIWQSTFSVYWQTRNEELFAGTSTVSLRGRQVYALRLGTASPNEFAPLTYEIEISATPADR